MKDKFKGQSYNRVMNEWAAQRDLKRENSSIFSSQGGNFLWGWIWRIFLMVLLPLLGYIGWMRLHMKADSWNTELRGQAQQFIGAKESTLRRSRWDWSGGLRVDSLKAKGGPSSFFKELEAVNMNTQITVPHVFKKAWHLKNLDAYSAAIHLRNGKPLATADNTQGQLAVLTAGWGISPDFSQLTIDSYSCRSLALSWGSSPANSGEIAGTLATMVKKGNAWKTTFEGGAARQGWLGNLRLTSLRVNITSGEARIEKGDFTLVGGGSGTISGSVTLTETPEIRAMVTMENADSKNFLADSLQKMIQFVCSGSVALSGSTNRNTGVVLDAKLSIKSGSIRSIPILRALEIVTSEPRLSQPVIFGGDLQFISKGASESGSIALEGNDILFDCGPLFQIGLNFRHERKPVMAENIKDAQPVADSVSVETSATLRIGLAPEIATKLNFAIRTEFGAREEGGFHWITIPYSGDEAAPTKGSADRMLQLHQGGN